VTNQLESMRGQDKRSPSVTEEESINSAWALFLLCYNNTGKFQTLLQECAVGEKCIMYLFYLRCSSRFEPCNSCVTSVCVEFYSRQTHSLSVLRLMVIQVLAGGMVRGASVAADPSRRDKGATN
jgi:hypothetical protein